MIQIPNGTKDVTPSESYKWQYLEKTARETARLFAMSEIRTPTFEHTELFLRGVGETTDVVGKEMYTFLDKGNRSLTLKPEGTAGVARSFVENNLGESLLPLKMYYFTPVFRHETPQKGRYREHHQFGVELYGSPSPAMDVEAIAAAHHFLDKVGVTGLSLRINSIGCPECRARYNAALKEYFLARLDAMCPTCKERLDKNPLRILDCKVPACHKIALSAPVILDYLCDDCKGHLDRVRDGLVRCKIPYVVDPHIVRGLDYYTRTVFEFVTDAIGAQGTVCGGGRYDNLVSGIGGKPTPAVGFGLGLERLLLVLEACGASIPSAEPLTVFVANAGEENRAFCEELVQHLRETGIAADCDRMDKSLKAQFRNADKIGAAHVITVGESERASGIVTVKNMRTATQEAVELENIAAYFLRTCTAGVSKG